LRAWNFKKVGSFTPRNNAKKGRAFNDVVHILTLVRNWIPCLRVWWQTDQTSERDLFTEQVCKRLPARNERRRNGKKKKNSSTTMYGHYCGKKKTTKSCHRTRRQSIPGKSRRNWPKHPKTAKTIPQKIRKPTAKNENTKRFHSRSWEEETTNWWLEEDPVDRGGIRI